MTHTKLKYEYSRCFMGGSCDIDISLTVGKNQNTANIRPGIIIVVVVHIADKSTCSKFVRKSANKDLGLMLTLGNCSSQIESTDMQNSLTSTLWCTYVLN